MLERFKLKGKPPWRLMAVTGATMLASVGVAVASFAGTAQAGASKAPIVIGSEAPVGTANVSYPGIEAALKAASRAINKAGGINGRPLKVFFCNTQYQPNQELACARQAISAGVIAMMASNIDFQGQGYNSLLDSAHVLDIENSGPLPTADEGPDTFPLTWGIGTFMPCVGSQMLKITGGHTASEISFSTQPAPTLIPLETAFAKANGVSVAQIATPVTVPDFGPYVTQAMANNSKVVMLQELGAGPQAFVRASSAAGAKYAICTAFGLDGSGVWSGLGSESNNVYVGAQFAPLSTASKLPEMKQFLKQMAAEKASGDAAASTSSRNFIAETMQAWLAVQAFAQVARKVKTVTRSSMLAAMHKATVTFGGIIPPVNFTKPESEGAYQHVYNGNEFLWKWDPAINNYTEVAKVPDVFKRSF